MRRSGPFSSLWAFVGRRWLLWAFLGLRWPSLAVVNCCGPLWACVGLRWPSLAAAHVKNQVVTNSLFGLRISPAAINNHNRL